MAPSIIDTFNTDFSSYEIVKTDDGYPTLYSKYFSELCHSNVGSYEETLHNYVHALDIKKMFENKNETIILEMGHGAGIGLLATMDEFYKSDSKNKLIYHSLEIDEGLVHWSLKNVFLERTEYTFIQNFKISEINGFKVFKMNNDLIEITIHIGDARKVIKELKQCLLGKVDAFYQDPFSPQKNPLLWTIEWFKDLYELGTDESVLSTYSASTLIRKSLLYSGWKFGNYLGYGTKRGMTKAFKQGEMDEILKEKVTRSVLTPLRDEDYK